MQAVQRNPRKASKLRARSEVYRKKSKMPMRTRQEMTKTWTKVLRASGDMSSAVGVNGVSWVVISTGSLA